VPDPLTNPVASVVVTPPPSPAPPQVQQPQGPPDQLPQGPGPQQFQPPAQATPTPAQRNILHSAAVGHGFKSLMTSLEGTSTQYQQTPNGPVPVQVQNKPGQLFRSILAGAILGAGAGSSNAQNDAGSGWSAAGRGAAAAQQGMQQQQQQRAAEAQKQWDNQRQANQDSQEEILRKAQIAHENAATLQLNAATQGADLEVHQKVADMGKASVADFKAAGIQPVVDGMSESQMTQYIQDHPGSGSLDWVHTGVKLSTVKDANGNEVPHYEYTLSAYDPNAKVPVSQATYDEWKKNGLFDRYPEYDSILKNGNKTLTVAQYGSIKGDAEKVAADNYAKQKQDLDIKKDQAAINADNARTAESLTNTNKIKQEISDAALGKTQAEQFNNALKELNDKGGNFDALKPSSRVVIAESMDKMVPALNTEYHNILASDDPDAQAKAGDVMSQIQNLTSLGTRALSGIGGGGTTPAAGASNIPPGALIAKNATTGETRYSTDNGKTWNVAGAQTPALNIDRFRSLSAHDREIALADPKISPRDEDKIRRSLGVSVPDDSKYDNDIEVQRQIKKMKGVPPDQVEDRLSSFGFTPGQLMAIIRGAKNAELASQ